MLLTSAVLGGGGAGLAAGRAAAAAVGPWGHTPSKYWHICFLALYAAVTCCLSLPVVSLMRAQTEHQYDLEGVVASKPKPRQHGPLRFAGGRYQGCCQMSSGGTRFGGIFTVLRRNEARDEGRGEVRRGVERIGEARRGEERRGEERRGEARRASAQGRRRGGAAVQARRGKER